MKRFLCLLLPFALLSTTTFAEEIDSTKVKRIDLNEVVVVGLKQDKLAKTAGSVSRLTGRTLSLNESNTVRDLNSLCPNLFIPDYGSRQNSPIFIRGIGSKALSPSVIFYVDGVPSFESNTFDTDLNGASSIEILRGPQGTLYGRNAIGGIINIYTPNPLRGQFNQFKIGYGSRNDVRLSTNNSFLLSDNLGALIQASYHHNDGFFKNITTGKKADKINEVSTRGKIAWQISPQWEATLLGTYGYTDQNGYPYGLYDKETKETAPINYNSPAFYMRTLASSGLNLRYSGDRISFTSQTSYQFLDDHQRMDQDFTRFKMFEINHFLRQHLVSQEFTLKSNYDIFYNWILGAFAFNQDKNEKVYVDYFIPIPGMIDERSEKYQNGNMANRGFAIYHQSKFNITQNLLFTAGLRFDYEYENITNSDYLTPLANMSNLRKINEFDDNLSFTQFTPKFTLSYDFLDGNLLYATVARGYKAGGFNYTVKDVKNDSRRTYDPEYNWNYELGTRFATHDNKLKGEAALFFIDWKDQQISYVVPALGVILNNAGHSTSKGFEVSLHYIPIKNLAFNLNYGYTDAKFKTYTKDKKIDYSGNYLPMVPKHTFSLNGTYTIEANKKCLDYATFYAGVTGNGPFYWMENNMVKQNFYAILNLKASLTKSNVTWEVWTRNTTKTNYLTNYFEIKNFVNGKMVDQGYGQKGKPFSVGTSIIIDF